MRRTVVEASELILTTRESDVRQNLENTGVPAPRLHQKSSHRCHPHPCDQQHTALATELPRRVLRKQRDTKTRCTNSKSYGHVIRNFIRNCSSYCRCLSTQQSLCPDQHARATSCQATLVPRSLGIRSLCDLDRQAAHSDRTMDAILGGSWRPRVRITQRARIRTVLTLQLAETLVINIHEGEGFAQNHLQKNDQVFDEHK